MRQLVFGFALVPSVAEIYHGKHPYSTYIDKLNYISYQTSHSLLARLLNNHLEIVNAKTLLQLFESQRIIVFFGWLSHSLFVWLKESLELNAVVLLFPIDWHKPAIFWSLNVLLQFFFASWLRLSLHPTDKRLWEGKESDQARLVEAAEVTQHSVITDFKSSCCEI